MKRLSNSVKKKSVPRDVVLKALWDWAVSIKDKRKEIVRIGHFGSYAKDNYGPASDVDILIILSSSANGITERMTEYYPAEFPLGCELFVYTEEEIKRLQNQNNYWINDILKETKWIV